MLLKLAFCSVLWASQLLCVAAIDPDYKIAKRNGTEATNWGVVVMPGASLLDVYGPLEMLYYLSMNAFLNLTIITPTEENVVNSPELGNPFNSIFSPEFVGSATIHDDLDLDVLMVPGGSLHLAENLTYIDDFLVKMRPSTDYLISICTGAIYPARAGLLNGRRATTNKSAWNDVTSHGENVTWVAPARFVIDGDIWSSSGVSAGIDLTLEWIRQWYGDERATIIAGITEVVPKKHDEDPFTDIFGVPHQGQI